MQNELFDCRNVDRGGLYCSRRTYLGVIWEKGGQGAMVEVMMFMLGFSGVVSVYEIVKTTKSTKSNAIRREAEKIGRKKK